MSPNLRAPRKFLVLVLVIEHGQTEDEDDWVAALLRYAGSRLLDSPLPGPLLTPASWGEGIHSAV
jgi:hypothetical protein